MLITDITILTSLFQIKALFENINQWIFSLVTESAHVVIHVKSPHHGASKVVLLHPVNLPTDRRGHCGKHFEIKNKAMSSDRDIEIPLPPYFLVPHSGEFTVCKPAYLSGYTDAQSVTQWIHKKEGKSSSPNVMTK